MSLSQSLPANDDNSTGAVAIGFTINFFGTNYSTLYVNNNGNVTFGSALGSYTSAGMSGVTYVTLAPFFADVDTRGTGTVTYGQVANVDGHPAFAVRWNLVGYYSMGTDKRNDFQLVIIDRSDRGVGDWDFEYNFGQIQWETGNASGGSGGLGGTSATVGYADGSPGTNDWEVYGSRIPGSFLDSNLTTGLTRTSLGSSICGRYAIPVVGGTPPDMTAPSVTSINRLDPSPTNATLVQYRATFSESVTNVDTGDFTLTTSGLSGTSITSVSAGPASQYTITVDTGSGSGSLRLDLTAGATIEDLAGNDYVGPYTGGQTYTLDRGAPTIVSVVRAGANPTNAASVQYTVTFSESVTGVGTPDFSLFPTGSVAGASVTGVSGGPATVFTVTVSTGSGSGTLRLDLAAGATITDLAGNSLVGPYTSGEAYTLDKAAPTVVSSLRAGTNPTNAGSVQFTVSFSESVTAVGTADFSLFPTGSVAGASVTSVSAGPATVFTVTVNTGSGSGTLRLDLSAGATITDLAGNAFIGPYTSGEAYTLDKAAPVVTSLLRADPNPTQSASVDFTLTFSKVVTGLTPADLTATVSGLTGASVTSVSSGPASVYTVTASTGSGTGTLRVDLSAGATVVDMVGNAFVGPYTSGEAYDVDHDGPTVVSVVRADPDPTRAASVGFTVTFNEPVAGVDLGDFSLAPSGISGAAVSGVTPGPSAIYTVTVDSGSGSGTLRLDLGAGATVNDLVGNAYLGPYAGGEAYTFDRDLPLVVSVLRQVPAVSPTNAAALTFRVNFSEAVTGVDASDFGVALTGAVTGVVSSMTPQSATVVDVDVSGVSGDGVVALLFFPGNDIADLVGNPLGPSPSIGTEETYTIDNTAIRVLTGGVAGLPGPVVILTGGAFTTHFNLLEIRFDSDADDPAGSSGTDDVTNPDNYLLVAPGPNGLFETAACVPGLSGDDAQVPTGPVIYDNNGGAGPFVASVTVNGGAPLPSGSYRLLVCGTTSIVDLTGNPLNAGVDTQVDFRIIDPDTLPDTGFALGRVTALPGQPASRAYTDSSMHLVIPRLGLRMHVVGVPFVDGTWDVTWLGNDAGWLEGSAYPTWEGNTVLTGHVWDAYNQPGPFVNLERMSYGDEVILEAAGRQYVYAMRSERSIRADDTAAILRHESRDWLTLLTCRGYDPRTESYALRWVVRAVLIEIR